MAKTRKAAASSAKPVKAKKSAKTKSVKSRAASPTQKKIKAKLPKKKHITVSSEPAEHAQILKSEVVYQGPLFRVTKDQIIEPSGKESQRDIIRHNGSVVILAVDSSKSKKDPWIVVERQYRHAANRYLWELPAGTLDPGEDPLAGAQRELEEETGYRAKKWKPLVEYFASPGFLGESMKVFVAEGLVAGEARPEEDEVIDFRLVKLSEVVKFIRSGGIMDGKTLSCVLLYHELTRKKK